MFLLRREAEAAYLSSTLNLSLSCGEVYLSHKQFGSQLDQCAGASSVMAAKPIPQHLK